MSLEERAVALGCAVSIDFDYFSRHSGGGGGIGWLPFMGGWGSGESAEGAADDVDSSSTEPPVGGGPAAPFDTSDTSPFLSDDDDDGGGDSSPWDWLGDDD